MISLWLILGALGISLVWMRKDSRTPKLRFKDYLHSIIMGLLLGPFTIILACVYLSTKDD